MQYWELIRRMLQQATHVGQFYWPEEIATAYHKDLVATNVENIPDLDDLIGMANEAELYLLSANYLRTGPRDTVPITLGARSLTELGEELLSWLSSESVVDMFESMDVTVDRGEIQRVLHQLNS